MAHVIRTLDELYEIQELTFDRYCQQGYVSADAGPRLSLCPELDLDADGTFYEHTTIYCIRGKRGNVIGTVSMTVDGPKGLHVDRTFPLATQQWRDKANQAGQKLAASWRIIVRDKVKPCIVGRLMDVVREVVLQEKIDVLLVTFHPSHENFYQHIGFETIAHTDAEHGLNSPSVLMGGTPATLHNWTRMRRRFFCD